MSDQRINVVCSNGHTSSVLLSQALRIIGEHQLNEVLAGLRLDAPWVSCKDCPECQHDIEIRDRRNRDADLELLAGIA